jgi:hypothetical protein
MGFRSLQHIQESKVHTSRVLPTRFVPPSGFGYPLDGFLPSIPRRLCFAPTALVGFALRSILLPTVARPFPSRLPHIPFVIAVGSANEWQFGPARPGFWGLDRPEFLADRCAVNASAAGCSLGLVPLQGPLPKTSTRISPGLLSRALPTSRPFRRKHPFASRHPRVSIGLRLALNCMGVCTPHRQGNPRGFAPVHPFSFGPSAALAMCSPCIASHITADCPMRFGPHPNLP